MARKRKQYQVMLRTEANISYYVRAHNQKEAKEIALAQAMAGKRKIIDLAYSYENDHKPDELIILAVKYIVKDKAYLIG